MSFDLRNPPILIEDRRCEKDVTRIGRFVQILAKRDYFGQIEFYPLDLAVIETVKSRVETGAQIHDEQVGMACDKSFDLSVQNRGPGYYSRALERAALEFLPLVGNGVVKALRQEILEQTGPRPTFLDAIMQWNE